MEKWHGELLTLVLLVGNKKWHRLKGGGSVAQPEKKWQFDTKVAQR